MPRPAVVRLRGGRLFFRRRLLRRGLRSRLRARAAALVPEGADGDVERHGIPATRRANGRRRGKRRCVRTRDRRRVGTFDATSGKTPTPIAIARREGPRRAARARASRDASAGTSSTREAPRQAPYRGRRLRPRRGAPPVRRRTPARVSRTSPSAASAIAVLVFATARGRRRRAPPRFPARGVLGTRGSSRVCRSSTPPPRRVLCAAARALVAASSSARAARPPSRAAPPRAPPPRAPPRAPGSSLAAPAEPSDRARPATARTKGSVSGSVAVSGVRTGPAGGPARRSYFAKPSFAREPSADRLGRTPGRRPPSPPRGV